MVFFTELLMGATKLAFSFVTGRKQLGSQAQVLEIRDKPAMRAFKAVFPLLMLGARFEDVVLARRLRGHMVVVKAIVQK